MDWKQKIPACFASENQVFSADRAFELLTYLRTHRIAWPVVQPEFVKHLEGQGRGPLHTAQQIVKIRSHMRPWLIH